MLRKLSQSSNLRSTDGMRYSDTYKNVFEVAYGGSEIFNNITGGLASAVGLI